MHYDYVVLCWDPRNPDQAAEATHMVDRVSCLADQWVHRYSSHGTLAATQRDAPGQVLTSYALAGNAGVIFGRLFARSSSAALSADAFSEDHHFSRLRGRARAQYLSAHFWGAYVAILKDLESGDTFIIRDCSGMVACYYVVVHGLTVVFSDPRRLPQLGIRPAPKLEYVAAFLALPQLEIEQTGLCGVSELLAGESLQVSASGHRTAIAWDPVAFCSPSPLRSEMEASSALRETTEACIGAWAPLFRPRIMHTLSGGFDSSVVLSSLVHSPQRPEIVCINRYSTGAAEDERAFARMAARACGTELIEVRWQDRVREFDHWCYESPVTAKPSVPYACGLVEGPLWNLLHAEYQVTGMWTGQGGDHLFMSTATVLGAVDALLLYGFGSRLTSALWGAVALTRQSIWHVLAVLIKATFDEAGGTGRREQAPRFDFVNREALPPQLLAYAAHPWEAASRRLPPGKRYQLLLLSDLVNRHRPLPGIRDIEDFHPLLSQPLMETALSIPLPLLLSGGRTRGLARTAFAGCVPAPILNRELKGQTSSYMLGLLRHASDFIARLLLDGLLVQHRIVRREALADVLRNDFPIAAETFFPLFACVAAEIWIRSWTSLPEDRLTVPPYQAEISPVICDRSGTQLQRVSRGRAGTAHREGRSRGRAD